MLLACQILAPVPTEPVPTPIVTAATNNATPDAGPTSRPLPTETARPQPTLDPGRFGEPGLGDPYFPLMGNSGYDVQHYTLDLDVDMDLNRIDGITTIQATATDPLSRFNLDFAGMEILAVQVNEAAAELHRSGGELQIAPSQPLDAGQDFTIVVEYAGTPGENLPPGVPEYSVGWTYYDEGVFVAGEPGGSSGWFPVNEHPLDKAAYTFRITVPESYNVAANGLLQETVSEGDSTTYVWDMADPMASYLVTLAIGDFDVQTSVTQSGVQVRNYFAEGLPRSSVVAFDPLPEMIDYFETVFGPYPFDAYGVVVHDLSLGFALETQTLSVFGRDFVDEDVVAHELAHQWFGDSVSLAGWQHIWLNEGFAMYASTLWLEHVGGEAVAAEHMELMHEDMSRYYSASSGFSDPVLIGDPGPDNLFDWAVYARGALTLHALRLRIGDEVFFDILREYASRYRDSNASTDDFIGVAEEVSGQELDDLFQAWLFEAELPELSE
jgi:aminopeptidase N